MIQNYCYPLLLPNKNSCFISLSNEYISESKLETKNLNEGTIVFKLSWEINDPIKKTYDIYVGWIGDILNKTSLNENHLNKKIIGLSYEFSRCIGLTNAIETNPNLLITLSHVIHIKITKSIHIEPFHIDDWEILQLNAEYLETNILRQISVVNHNQKIPLWIHGDTLVHIIAKLPNKTTFCRLSTNTELIVIPKDRKKNVKKKNETNINTNVSYFPSSSSLYIQPPNVYNGDLLAFNKNSMIQLNPLPNEIFIHFQTFLKIPGAVQFNKKTENIYVKLKIQSENDSLKLQDNMNSNVSTYDTIRLQLLKDNYDKYENELNVLNENSLNNRNITTGNDHFKLSLQLPNLVGIKKIFHKLVHSIFPSIHEHLCVKRFLMNYPVFTPPPIGSFYMYGPHGVGKTVFIQNLLHDLYYYKPVLARSVTVKCRELSGVSSMKTIKTAISDAFHINIDFNGPFIIFLDDLDTIIPAENDQSDKIQTETKILKNHLVKEMLNLRKKQNKHLQNIFKSISSQLNDIKEKYNNNYNDNNMKTEIKQKLHSITKDLELYCREFIIIVIATGESLKSIHPSLLLSNLFDNNIELNYPNAKKRKKLIQKKLLLNDNIRLNQDICINDLITRTEGYNYKDLINLITKIKHEATMRYGSFMYSELNNKIITKLDIENAIKDFIPIHLKSANLFKSNVQWIDVGGMNDIKVNLKEILELPMKYEKLYRNAPIKLPAGILLYGPPGCGKTYIAEAIANECGLNFISVKGPEVLNKYIGASEEAVRNLFYRASSAKPCILFLDEFDSIAPKRGSDHSGVTDRVVNQLLTFLDGIESREGIYVLAATSRPDMIDPALLRPGRLDKSIYCGYPNENERLDILKCLSRELYLDDSALNYLNTIATCKKSSTFSGADLQAILISAEIKAVHTENNKTKCTISSKYNNNLNEKVENNRENQENIELNDYEYTPIINESHLKEVVEEIRPSITKELKEKFDRIYNEFSGNRLTKFNIVTDEMDKKITALM